MASDSIKLDQSAIVVGPSFKDKSINKSKGQDDKESLEIEHL